MIVLAELQPLDRVTGTRKMLRAASANHRDVNALNNVVWRPAISGEPSTAIRLFKGDFDGQAAPAGGNISIQIDQFLPEEPNARSFAWQGAPVKFYAGEIGQPWPWQEVFTGLVDQGTAEKNKVSLTCKVNTAPFDADILTLKYTGAGGEEGPNDFKDTLKPWLLGRCFNVEPRLINAVDNVYQFSAYGPIQAVTALYERGSDFGPSAANYATYAALIAATIAPGAWATCLSAGMVRLGAPAFGVITGDVDGDNFGGMWRSTTGAIILRVANGVSPALIEAASFTALDTAMLALPQNGMIGVYLSDQESVLSFAARLASPCNAQVGVSLLGKMFVGRIAIGEPALTLDAQQRQLPAVISSSETTTSPPYSYIEMGYARSWRVHTDDEIVDYKALVGDVEAANAAIAAISNDNLISASEKPNLIFRRDVILSVQSSTVNTASGHGISSAAYTAAITALTNYLATLTTPTLWSDLSGDTNVDGPTLRARFKSVYDEQTILSNVIAARTSTVEAGATVGGKLGTNVTNASGALVNESDILNIYNDRLTNFTAYGTGGGQIVGNVLSKTGGFGDNVAIISNEGGRAFSVTCRYDLASLLRGYIGLTNQVEPTIGNQTGFVCYARMQGSGQASSIQFFVTGQAASPSFTVAAAQITLTGTIQVIYEGANCLFYVNGVLLHQAISTVQGATVRASYMPTYTGIQGQITHVSYSAANNAQWASIGGLGVPADYATADVALVPFGTGIVVESNRFKNISQNIAAGVRSVNEFRGGAFLQFQHKGILSPHVSLYDPAAALPANNGGQYYATLNKVAGTETWSCVKRNIHGGQAFASAVSGVTWSAGDMFGVGYDSAKWYIFKNGQVVFSENAAAEGLRLKAQIIAYAGSSPNAWVAERIGWSPSTDNSFASLGGLGLTRSAYETAQGIAAGFAGAGDLAYRNAATLPFGSNAAVNSEFASGLTGWFGQAQNFGLNLPNYYGRRNVFFATQSQSLASGQYVDVFYTDAAWGGSPVANALRFGMPCVQNDRVFVRALLARHRCNSRLNLLILNAAGVLVQAEGIDGGRLNGAANGDPANFDDINGVFTVTHPEAAFATLMVRMLGTGGSTPHVFVTEPMIAKLSPNQTAIPTYTSGRTDPMADVTASSQIMATMSPSEIIYRTFTGEPKPNQYPRIIAPMVFRGGADIRKSDEVSYVLTLKNMAATVDNVNGSATKGQVTVTGGTGGYVGLTVKVNNVAVALVQTNFVMQDDPPPSTSGSGGTVKSASDASLAPVTSNAFAPVTSTGAGENIFTLTLAVGEKLKGAGSLQYQSYQGTNQIFAQWQYRLMGTSTWLALAGTITGSVSVNEIDPQTEEEVVTPGSISVVQEKTGLAAGQYEMQLVARGNTATTQIEFFSGTATAMAQV